MMIEKRMLAYGVIAMLIGIASISPLMFWMSAKAQTFPEDQPQFSIEMKYAYVGDYWNKNSVTTNQSYGWVYSLVFNTSPNFYPNITTAEAIFEYYTVEISSENGFVGNMTFFARFMNNDNYKPNLTFYRSEL